MGKDRRMQAFIAFGYSSFFHGAPHQAKSKSFLPKTYCSMREQRRISLRTTWPSISLSLWGSGFFLGPLIDGLHSRVNLVEYQSGSIDIGPFHTDIWVPFLLGSFYCTIGLLQLFLDERASSKKSKGTPE